MSQIFEAELSDTVELARIQREAFQFLPIITALFGNVSNQDHEGRNEMILKKGILAKDTVVLKAVLNGQIVGIGLLGIPHSSEEEVEEPPVWTTGTNVELAEEFFGEMDRRDKLIKEPHYHYHIIGVDPSHHAQGVGEALVKAAKEKSNLDGRKIYLDATELAVPLYTRCGFLLHGDAIVVGKDSEFKLDPMVYTPASYTAPI